MITEECVPKILDFGLARIEREETEPVDSEAPTVTMVEEDGLPSLTQGKNFMGSTSYMSPEQIEGKKVDVRSDLFSFGIVMYEALMGQRPFKDDTVESVIGRILTEEPNAVTALKPVIRQCLKKDRGNRMQTAQQLYSTVEDVQQEVQAGTVLVDVKNMSGSSIGHVSRRPRWAVTTFLLVVIASILTFWFFDSDAPLGEIPYRKIQLPMPASTSLYNGPAISPDGTMIVYTRGNRLWGRDLRTLESRELTDSVGGERPFWSPDRRSIGYFIFDQGLRSIRTISVTGGASHPVSILPTGSYSRGGAWDANDEIVFGLGTGARIKGRLNLVPTAGGVPTVFLEPDAQRHEEGVLFPQFLPDGTSLLCVVTMSDGSSELIGLAGEVKTTLLHQTGEILAFPNYDPSGYIVYQRGFQGSSDIWAMPFDLEGFTRTGDPFPTIEQAAFPSVATDGTLIYLPKLNEQQLVWVDRFGRVTDEIGQPQETVNSPAWSPDDQLVAVSAIEKEDVDIWIHDVNRGTKTRLPDDQFKDWSPSWSPSGEEIIFQTASESLLGGDLYKRSVDGRSPEPLIVTTSATVSLPHWSTDGKYIIFRTTDTTGYYDISYIELSAPDRQVSFLRERYSINSARRSPDGDYVAYSSNASGRLVVSTFLESSFPQVKGLFRFRQMALCIPNGEARVMSCSS